MSHMEINQTLAVKESCVFFDVHKVSCDEICLISSGLKFVRVSAFPENSRFNITIPPTDIDQASFNPNTGPYLSTLVLKTNPDSGSKICKALQIKPNMKNENSSEIHLCVIVQFTGDGEKILTLLEQYFSIFSGLNWKLARIGPKTVFEYLEFIANHSSQTKSSIPELGEVSSTKENEEISSSILTKSTKTYSSSSQTTMFSPTTRSSATPKQSPSYVRPKANVLRSKSTETPSIIDIEIDSDDDDDTENQRSLNGSISSSDDHLFSYPPDEIDRISIHKSDLPCLEEGQYLNDTILGFYLKHIERHLTEPTIAERTYIFSTFFYHKLTHRTRDATPQADTQSVSDKYYNRVKNWTKNINIFDKDFLIIPINKSYHWFLAIICYPRKVPDFDEILPIEIEKNPKRPCILFMDSLQSAHSRCGLAGPIRHFLAKEWESKKRTKKNFSKDVMKDIYLKVPKQSNSFDCGLYVLQYIENFLRNPDFLLEKTCNGENLEDWFSSSLVACKRRAIKRLIKQLREAEEMKKNGNSDIMMETEDS